MAIITVKNRAITLDAAEIPNLDASKITSGSFADARIPNLATSKITSGTFADARIAASNVNQHATSFDDNKLVNDISTLGLRVHTQENLNVSNTNSASFDVFQDSSGITSLTNVARNASEYISSVSEAEAYETGDRESQYTISLSGVSNSDVASGDFGNWLNGSITTGATNGWYWSSSGSNMNGNHFTFDLGSGNSKIYTGAKLYQDRRTGDGSTPSSGTWKWQGSNDNSSYTDLISSFTWSGNDGIPVGSASPNLYTSEPTWSNNTAYRYIRLIGIAGATNTTNPWQMELEFKVKTITTNATGSFEGAAITAGASTSKMGAVITYQDNAGTNTLNTDIVLKLSANNGSNYSTATLTALPDFATGIKMAKVNDLSVTAGSSLKYKLEFANQSNSKNARIRGVSLQY